jgi:hypothetical protein
LKPIVERKAYCGRNHPDETAKSLRIQLHYRRKKMYQGWGASQVKALCVRLNITIHELATLFLISPPQMKRMLRANHFPPHIALHFAILEQWSWAADNPQPQPPENDVFPAHIIQS